MGYVAGYGRAMGGLCAALGAHAFERTKSQVAWRVPRVSLMNRRLAVSMAQTLRRAKRFFATMANIWDAVLPAASPERARSCSAGDK